MDSQAHHLDSRVKLVWFFPTALAIAMLWLIASAIYAALAPDGYAFGLSHVAFPFVLLAALIALAGLPVYLWVELTYRNFTYQLAEREIIIREGVLTRKTTVIPYVRIQDISSVRSLFERLVGLATVEIETAGSSRVASETLIPGIANKDEFIRAIMARVEKARSEGSANAEQQEGSKSVQELLSEMMKELKTISIKLDNLSSQDGKKPYGINRAQGKKSEFEEYEKFKKG